MHRKAKKVMVFGVFDLLHPGHLDFFMQAKKLGSSLVVSVARDVNVFKIKGEKPIHDEKQRKEYLEILPLVDKVVLGGVKNPWPHILKEKPDVIALGYDQQEYVDSKQQGLEVELVKHGLKKTRVIRLKAYKPKTYKSKILRQQLNFSGIVRKNTGRGKELGFPTANLEAPIGINEGIYIARANNMPALVFIGNAKTFYEHKRQAEAYLLDFSGDLYGQRLEIELLKRIRGNEKFASAEDLVARMKEDELEARKYFVI